MSINHTTGRHLVLATDGACLGNPGRGGWAVIIHELDGDAIVSRSALAGRAEGDTTNNRMELRAAIAALEHIAAWGLPAGISTDSQYVQKGVTQWLPNWKTNGWRTSDRKPVKNRDLWDALDRLQEGSVIEWRWVKAHTSW
jgi:ribonuclease HI